MCDSKARPGRMNRGQRECPKVIVNSSSGFFLSRGA